MSTMHAIRRQAGWWLLLAGWAISIPGDVRAADAEVQFAGHPLGYWVAQAEAAERSQPLERVIEALADAVRAEDPATKVAAADALGTLGPAALPAVPALIAQQDHEQPWVRSSAAAALVAVGKEAVPALLELFRKQNGGPSVRAAFILGAIGPDAKAAAAVVAEVMARENPVMQARYAGILNQIDPAHYPGHQTRRRGAAEVDLADLETPGADEELLAAGWPGFHGPRRDAICRERGLLAAWPAEGPPLLWTLRGLGKGFSSVSIAGGRLFTMGDQANASGEQRQFLLAFDLADRSLRWRVDVGAPFRTGPRCTPTVAGELVYALGTEGGLVCAISATGQVRWQRDLTQDFDGKLMSGWKYSESPLVDGDRLICTPGGPKATVVALDRRTGKLLWQCAVPSLGDVGADGAGYSSPAVAEIHGVRQYVQFVGRGVVGIEAETGRFLWGYNRIASNVANIPTPTVRGNYVFVTEAYNVGSALLDIRHEDGRWRAEEVYFLGPRDFQNHHGGVVAVGGQIYGGHKPNSGLPTCLDLATGRIRWQAKAPARGSASVLYADGRLIFRYDRGDVVLVEATPEAFRIKGRFTAVKGDGPAWAHPVVYHGRLYLRHGDLLACYDLRAY